MHYETTVQAAVNSAKASWMTSYDNVQSGNYSPPQLGRNFGPWSEISRASSNSTTQWDSGVDKVFTGRIVNFEFKTSESDPLDLGQIGRHSRRL